MNDKNALLTIQAMLDSMHTAEQRIATAILDSPESVVNMNIIQLSAICSVSSGSIVRFCQTIGFEGFRQLKLNLAYYLNHPEITTLNKIHKDDDVKTLVEKIFGTHMKTLDETVKMLNYEKLQQAVDAIINSKNIGFFAIDTSAPVVQDVYYRFLRIGIPAILGTDTHVGLVSASYLNHESVAIGVSHSGRSREVINMLELAKRSGATVIAITSNAGSPITKIADIELVAYYSQRHTMKEGISARLAHTAVLDCLYVCAAIRKYKQTIKNMGDVAELLDEPRIKISDP